MGNKLTLFNNDLDNLFIFASYTYDSITINGNGVASIIPVNTNIPSGYTPVSLRQFNTTSQYVYMRSFNSNDGGMNLKNISSQSISITPTVSILCVKTSYLNN